MTEVALKIPTWNSSIHKNSISWSRNTENYIHTEKKKQNLNEYTTLSKSHLGSGAFNFFTYFHIALL